MIWKDLLHIERIGRTDSFFALGGHSVLGIQLLARVAERFSVQLSAISIFRAPTVRQLAQLVEGLSPIEPASSSAGQPELGEGVV